MRHDLIYLLLLVISAVVFAVFIGPALKMHNMSWLGYVFYGLLILAFFYGRLAGIRTRPPS